MYKFYKTDNKIIERDGVIRQLAELESTDAKVEISKTTKNGKIVFICKISDEHLVRSAEGNSPESACDNACDAFMRDMRKSKNRIADNAISRRRSNKNDSKATQEELEEELADENVKGI